jgi:hypothetical protein
VLQSGPLAPEHSLAHITVAHESIPRSRAATEGEAAAVQVHLQAAPEPLVLQVPSQLSVVAQLADPLGMPPPAGQSVGATALK